MSINLDRYDCKYFVGLHFKANLVILILSGLMIFSLDYSLIKLGFIAFLILSLFLVFIMFYRVKNSNNIIRYARHRILSMLIVSFHFMIISLCFSMVLGFIFFEVYFAMALVSCAVILFLHYKSDKHRYDAILNDCFSSEESITLFEFFLAIGEYKSKKNSSSIILAIFFSQFALVFVVSRNFFLYFDYKLHVAAGIFFFLSCYYLNDIRLYVLSPYHFLLKKEKE